MAVKDNLAVRQLGAILVQNPKVNDWQSTKTF